MSDFAHTEATDSRIRRGYEGGERVVAIAADLNVTRNVVIGRARRLGLTKAGRQFDGLARFHATLTQEQKSERGRYAVSHRWGTAAIRKGGE